MRRATVGWETFSFLEAASVDPSLKTERNTRISDQFRNPFFIFLEQHNFVPDTRKTGEQLLLLRQRKQLGKDHEMASHTMSPSIWTVFGGLFGRTKRGFPEAWKPRPTADDFHAERDYINDVIWSNPDAFSSELDVQNMVSLYPGRF